MKDEELDRMFQEVKDLPGVPEGSTFDQRQAWNRIEQRLETGAKGGTGFRYWWMAAAAILLLAVVSFLLLQPKDSQGTGQFAEKGDSTTHEALPAPQDQMAMETHVKESLSIESDDVVPQPHSVPPKPAPRKNAPLKLHQEPLMAAVDLNKLPADTALEPSKSMVKVRVILGENKPDKEAILHAEWEKQNRLRIQMHDQFTDRIRTGGNENTLFPEGHSPLFHHSIDLNKIKQEEQR